MNLRATDESTRSSLARARLYLGDLDVCRYGNNAFLYRLLDSNNNPISEVSEEQPWSISKRHSRWNRQLQRAHACLELLVWTFFLRMFGSFVAECLNGLGLCSLSGRGTRCNGPHGTRASPAATKCPEQAITKRPGARKFGLGNKSPLGGTRSQLYHS